MRQSQRQALQRFVFVTALAAAGITGAEPAYFNIAPGAGAHDVAAAPSAGGPGYYTAQRTGKLGILDPTTGRYEQDRLRRGSAAHRLFVSPDAASWTHDRRPQPPRRLVTQ